MSNKYNKPQQAPAVATEETKAPTDQVTTNTATDTGGDSGTTGQETKDETGAGSTGEQLDGKEGADETKAEGSENTGTAEGTDKELPKLEETAPAPVAETIAPVVVAPVVEVAAKVEAPVAELAASSIANAQVSTSPLDGGIPARAAGFRDALNRYIVDMAPGISQDPVVGGRTQAGLFSMITNAIKDKDIRVFTASMEILVDLIKANNGDRQVFNERYALRFAANFAGGKDAVKQWTYLWTILFAVTSENPSAALKQIDWNVALRQFDETSKVRLQTWCLQRA